MSSAAFNFFKSEIENIGHSDALPPTGNERLNRKRL